MSGPLGTFEGSGRAFWAAWKRSWEVVKDRGKSCRLDVVRNWRLKLLGGERWYLGLRKKPLENADI